MDISVVITTYNRSCLVGRAIDSVLAQQRPGCEVLVIDDASADGTAEAVGRYPTAGYLRQPYNQGLNAARNRGLDAAAHPWVFFLDDDDTLLPGALTAMANSVRRLPDWRRYPLFGFLDTETRMHEPYRLLQPADLLRGLIRGNCRTLIYKPLFDRLGYRYHQQGYGGSGILRLEVAERHGIPTWAVRVTEVHHDGGERMCSARSMVRRARASAELQELYLSRFGDLLRRAAPETVGKRRLGAGVYWLLAGERKRARRRLKEALLTRHAAAAAAAGLLTLLPVEAAAHALAIHRRAQAVSAATRATLRDFFGGLREPKPRRAAGTP